MKTHLFLLLSVITGLLFPQNVNDPAGFAGTSIQPPSIVMTTFSKSYQNVKALWTLNDDNTFYATFYDETSNMGRIIIYDINGNLVAVENELHNNGYPVAIAAYYIKNYPKEKFVVWSYYDTNDHKTYFVNREPETVWFDRDGKFTQTVKRKNQLITRKS